MFTNPLDELNRQASQSCALVLAFMALPFGFVILLFVFGLVLIKLWPLFLLGLLAFIAYRLMRRHIKPKTHIKVDVTGK